MPKDPDFGSTGRRMEEKIDVVEKGLNTHIRGRQIGRRGFLKVIAGLGAMATTLALPSALNIGNDDLKPLIRKVEASKTDKPPYEVPGPYKRFSYDEQFEVYPVWLACMHACSATSVISNGTFLWGINARNVEEGENQYSIGLTSDTHQTMVCRSLLATPNVHF